MQFLCVLCGVFGGKVMPKVSKGVRNQFGLKALVLEVLIWLDGYHHIFFFFKLTWVYWTL